MAIASKLLVLVTAIALGLLALPASERAFADTLNHERVHVSDVKPDTACLEAERHCCQAAHCVAMYWPPASQSALAASPGPQPASRAITMISIHVPGIDPPPRSA